MFVHNTKLQSTKLADPALCVQFTAGVICFSVAPVTGNIFLLLGLEDKQNLYCDFGGSINPSESPEGAAAREFCEESLCVINISLPVSFPEYECSIKKMLQSRNYLAKLEILQNTVDGIDQVRVYYIKQIPWQPCVKKSFQATKEQLLNGCIIHPAVLTGKDDIKHVDDHWLEKKKIKYWSLDRLRDVLKNNGKYKQHRFRKTFLPALAIVIKHLDSIR